jgi:hypothetical protein
MPTISQLPPTVQVTAADELPLSQSGVTHSVSIGTLLAGMQSAVIVDTGTLLGRISMGAGGPEAIVVGPGLLLSGGTLSVSGVVNMSSSSQSYSITGLTTVATVAANDLVGISQGGQDHSITYASFLSGLTIDLAQPAVPAADSDELWVAQGSNTMLRQTFAAVWSWVASKMPTYKQPVVEITTNTTLDGTVHNGRILICSQPITFSPAAINMGSGFNCDIINLSGGNVTLGSGIMTSSGTSLLAAGQAASLSCLTYSGGTVVFAWLPGSGSGGGTSGPTLPGQVTGVTPTSPTTTSVVLTWSAPSSGGSPSSYTVQYCVSGATTWTIFAQGLTATTTTVTGLIAGTAYNFQVYAVNAAGSGQPSASASGSTAAVAGIMISATWNMVPSGSYAHGSGFIGVNAHINPSTATVQFGFSTSSTMPPTTWTVAAYVNSDLWGAYVPTPSTTGTWYAWVEGTDGSAPTVYPTAITVT